MIDVDIWCKRALASVFSLWDDSRCSAWRSSQDRVAEGSPFRPTVTCNAVLTFDDYGLFGSPVMAHATESVLSGAARVLEQLLCAGKPDLPAENWISQISGESAHKEGKRRVILLSNLFSAVEALAKRQQLKADYASRMRQGILDATKVIEGLFPQCSDGADNSAAVADALGGDPTWSPYLALYTSGFIADRARLAARCEGVEPSPAPILMLHRALDRYFDREVDRIMARRGIAGDSGFDAASLAFSLKGALGYRDAEFRESAFYGAVVDAIIEKQNGDGTWPDGVTALSEPNADTLQQPSVKIGLTLMHCVFEPRMLVRFRAGEMHALERALSALEKLATYLASTYVVSPSTRTSGWASDRVRWPNTAETWITALVARFFLALRFARRAVQRARTLRRFTTRWPGEEQAEPAERRTRWNKLLDPCQVLRPFKSVADAVIEPILQQQEAGQAIVRPAENGVSMIICGPPGSGKTYFVSQLAEAVSWPVVELSPGNFVSQGAELIESKAAEIFGVLHELDHAIVFFDECDELFLDREQQQGPRSILSFVTASMLPKLQQLHDHKSVVFIVATNYLSRIDKAIRRPGRFDLVLLLDRPDDAAREHLLRKSLSSHPDLLRLRVAETAGLTTKEILDYVKLSPRDQAPSPGSRIDYVEWCRADASTEIDATRASTEEKGRIKDRWRELVSQTDGSAEPPMNS